MLEDKYYYTLKQLALMFDIDAETIRYHVRKGHLEPKKAFHNGKLKYIFSLLDVKRLKEYLQKEAFVV